MEIMYKILNIYKNVSVSPRTKYHRIICIILTWNVRKDNEMWHLYPFTVSYACEESPLLQTVMWPALVRVQNRVWEFAFFGEEDFWCHPDSDPMATGDKSSGEWTWTFSSCTEISNTLSLNLFFFWENFFSEIFEIYCDMSTRCWATRCWMSYREDKLLINSRLLSYATMVAIT
jgi:hypothetical protein